MARTSFVIAVPTCLGAWMLLVAGAACESTLNLGDLGVLGEAMDGSTEAAADSALPTCESTCARLIDTCHLLASDQRGECLAECTQKGRQSDLSCAAVTACEAIVSTCGNAPTDGSTGADGSVLTDYEIRLCQSGCDDSHFFDCIDAAEHTACRALCETTPATKRNSYQACQSGAGRDCPRARDCFAVFTKN